MDSIAYLTAYGLVNSVVYGLLLFLLGAGLTIIFGMLGVLNVAHASFYMMAAYIGYSIIKYTDNFWLALLIAPLVVAILGAIVERTMLRSVRRHGHAGELLLTLGLAFVFLEFVKFTWGTEPHPIAIPPILQGSVSIGNGAYPIYRFFIGAVGLTILGITYFVISRTRLGMLIRASVSDSPMVRALGYDVDLLFTGTFALGTWLAGVAGVIAAPMLGVFPAMGANALVDMFTVVIVGGLGSLFGAFVASMLLGTIQSFGVMLAPKLAMFFSFFLLAAVIIWRPLGLFGERER